MENARCPYFFSAGLSGVALLFSDPEEAVLLFEVSALLSDDDPDADPLPLEEPFLEESEDFFA
jgi:hypothetical protein